MPKTSAGLLMYRFHEGELQVLLVHPGGPFWAKRDAGAWSIPKGEAAPGEDPLSAACREFEEETRVRPTAPCLKLAPVTQRGGKIVEAWAFEGDCDPSQIRSDTFQIEWPPRSGQMREFPEIDRAAFFGLRAARAKINPAQTALLDELEQKLTHR